LDSELKELKLDVSKAVTDSIRDELLRFIALKTISSKSKLTEKDALELGIARNLVVDNYARLNSALN